MPTATATTPYEAALRSVEKKTGTKRTTLPAAAPSPSRKVAGGKKAVGLVGKVAAKMEQDSKAKTAAIKAGKLTKKERGTGNGSGPGVGRITESWKGKGGKEVEVGAVVKAPGIASLTCVGRWTKRKGEQKIPFITGTTADGTRKNVAAADCTVVKAPAKKK